jgi:manganese-dependent inorganic pyrophosphatase
MASLADIVTTFGGSLVTGSLSDTPEEQFLMVAAMAQESFGPRLQRYLNRRIILFVGDRPHIHELAVTARVHAIVGHRWVCRSKTTSVPPPLAANVTMISSPHDTATSVLLARGAVRVERMIEAEYQSFHADTRLDEARQLAAQSAAFVFPGPRR